MFMDFFLLFFGGVLNLYDLVINIGGFGIMFLVFFGWLFGWGGFLGIGGV